MALIEINNLVKVFDTQKVLAGVNLKVVKGEIKVVMGPSGCGKSTLLRCINRLNEPTSGSIFFKGENITQPNIDLRALRQSIGFVFQQFALYRHLTVLENVTLALTKIHGINNSEAKEKAMYELSRFEMATHHDKYPAQISGGQKQRVAIARALAMDPDVILFDEPTSALDPIMCREVAMLINKLLEDNVTILCVTHDLVLARQLSDKVAFLDNGIIKAEDTFNNLCNHHPDQQVRSFFKHGNQNP